VATHDYVIANGTGAAVRSDLNDALAAIVSLNSSASAPATTYAYMLWADTTAGIMKMRNGANSAWVSLWELDGTFIATDVSLSAGTAGAPSLYFTGDTNTGIYSPGADQVGIATGGTVRLTTTTTGITSALAVDIPLGAVGTPSIAFTGDLNTGIYSPGADQIAITTGGTGRLFIDSSGRLLAGTSTARTNFFGTTLSSLTQIEGTGGSTARGSLSVLNNDVSNNPPYVLLGRSGAATLGSNAAVVSGSRLGTLTFHGADGTSFIEAATVAGEVDGTPGSNDMPGRLVFSTTADGAASPTERLRITSAGLVGIGDSAPSAKLVCNGHVQITSSTTPSTGAGLELSYGQINASRTSQQSYNRTGGAYLGSDYDALDYRWYVSGSEKVRLTSTGLGIGTTSVGNKLVVAQSVSSTFGTAGTYIGIGDVENGSGSYRLIGFGYRAASTDEYPAVIGYTETSNAGNTKGALVFGTRDVTTNTAPTERMRITSNGALRIACANQAAEPSATNSGVQLFNTSGGSLFAGSGTGTENQIIFFNLNGIVGRIQTSGSATSFVTSSDYRLKENVEPITGAANRLLQLKPCRFNFIADANKTVDGFIAHEVQEVVPEAISGDKDAVDDKGDPDYQGIDQSKLVPLLTAALQEAVAEIKALKDRVTALEGE
jgi:hypothetical protein